MNEAGGELGAQPTGGEVPNRLVTSVALRGNPGLARCAQEAPEAQDPAGGETEGTGFDLARLSANDNEAVKSRLAGSKNGVFEPGLPGELVDDGFVVQIAEGTGLEEPTVLDVTQSLSPDLGLLLDYHDVELTRELPGALFRGEGGRHPGDPATNDDEALHRFTALVRRFG